MFRIIKIITILSIIIGLCSCSENDYVEYKPHYLSGNNEHKYFGKAELDSLAFDNTIQVLKYYGHEFETKNGNVILISKKLSKDWELLYNFTSKSNNKEWLEMHQPE